MIGALRWIRRAQWLPVLLVALLLPPHGNADDPELPVVHVHMPHGLPDALHVGDAWATGTIVERHPLTSTITVEVPSVADGLYEAAMRGLQAEPDIIYKADFIPDDPLFSSMYGPQLIGAPTAWDSTIGSGDRIIAIIDTGVDLDHPDLASRLWTNPDEIPGNGLDDDANGFVDDVHGFDFINDDGDPEDDQGHGTHVAGTAAAAIDNGVGVAGIANARIMVVKVLDAGGSGSSQAVANGILYAAANGAHVINLSLGSEMDSLMIRNAVGDAAAAGVFIAAAAGNTGSTGDHYPAAYAEAISVAAIDASSQRADFSTRGSHVELAAPGVDILSTMMPCPSDICSSTGYGSISGTSMATPHVAGAAALVWDAQADLGVVLDAEDVRLFLQATADDLGINGRDSSYGFGRVDLDQAVTFDPPVSFHMDGFSVTQRAGPWMHIQLHTTNDNGEPAPSVRAWIHVEAPQGFSMLYFARTSVAGSISFTVPDYSTVGGTYDVEVLRLFHPTLAHDAASDVAGAASLPAFTP